MIEFSFYSVLTSAQAVTAITASRIYPLIIPEDCDLPAISYLIIGGSASPTNDTRGIIRLRVEINCFGDTYADAVNLRAAVIQSLDGYVGNGLTIQLLQPTDLFDHEARIYRAMVEFYVFSSI